METTNEKTFTCTLFSNCISNKGVSTDLFKFLEDIKSGTDKAPVEEARKLFANGDSDKAAEKKRRLRAIIPTGYMPNGRTMEDEIQLNGICMADIDIHNADWSLNAMEKLKNYPGIIGMHRTVRYGLRIFILMPKGTTLEDFKFVETVILDSIDDLLDCQHDEQATTLVHLSSTSYDPETWIVDKNAITEFPFEEALSKIQKEVFRELNGEEVPKKQRTYPAQSEMTEEEAFNQCFDDVTGRVRKPYSKAQLDDHLSRCTGRYPLINGSRNRNLIRLGQYAHFMRYTAKELDYIIKSVTFILHSKEYNYKRVSECVCWGYRHNNKQIDFAKIAKQDFLGIDTDDNESMSQMSHVSPYKNTLFEEVPQEADFQRNFAEVVEESCPYLSDYVYNHMPEFFKKLMIKSRFKRDNDIIFLANMNAVSAALPNVTVRCRKKDYSPHFFFLCIGPAGSGKAAASKSPELLEPLQERIESENNRRSEEFVRQEIRWKMEIKRAFKEDRDPNWDLRPKETPTDKTLIIEPHTSRSQLITKLAQNPQGIYMSTTELNSINESLNSDAGHYCSTFTKVAMNEKLGFDYKCDNHSVKIKFPKLALSAQGTPGQYTGFIGNTHEGMESRALTLLTSSDTEWYSWGDEDEGDGITAFDQAYKDAGEELIRIHDYLLESPTHVTVPKKLRYYCDHHCDYYFQRLESLHLDSLTSIVKRAPIMIARICSILCALRKYEMRLPCTEMEATEEDVEIALQITITLLRHTCIATTMLVDAPHPINKLQNVFKNETLYDLLPESFTTAEFLKLCIEKYHWGRATIHRVINDWMKDGFLERPQKGIYTKTKKAMI